MVSPVGASRRNALLGLAGACAGLVLPFSASAAQAPLKVDLSVPRTDRPSPKAFVPGVMYQKFDKPTAGGLVYVGRGTGGKGGTGG